MKVIHVVRIPMEVKANSQSPPKSIGELAMDLERVAAKVPADAAVLMSNYGPSLEVSWETEL